MVKCVHCGKRLVDPLDYIRLCAVCWNDRITRLPDGHGHDARQERVEQVQTAAEARERREGGQTK